ncbi:hypothetical protein GS597_06890 [Synechococcales cyanobacterium C]|uniref:Uncharacterized protein n=1 Tax=Petrachloros mirabilis ULC683 TaxID=2781853 RepID=A0A8K2A6W3_9CYAN|nr:AAA-like domain-containing protein [Petrachloros mirabilis]NCJ06246.1 hypothetical protein [Petrachloros mirabilis ULC683]
MTINLSSPYRHLGGSLPLDDPTYVTRNADQELYQFLQNGEFCYVLNSRQMGKSSLRVRVMQRLQAEGVACGVVDLSAMGTESTKSVWYKGVAYRILRNFRAAQSFDWRQWWKDHEFLSPVQQLSELIQEVLLSAVQGNIVIFIDEIDSVLSFQFSTDDFFSWIRSCYNHRADNADYRRLTFCLLGVATPSDLISDKKRTPFNLGRAIALNGFEFEQAQAALQPGLVQAAVQEPERVLREILDWTGGQPFLTQKLCQLVASYWNSSSPSVEEIVKAHILTNWETQDEPEHLRTIRDRFYSHPDRTNRLLALYQQILSQNGIKSDESQEQRELRLTGVTVKRHDQLQVFNPIYSRVFDETWVAQALSALRPYAQSLQGWVASDREDRTQLLSGTTLQAAKAWSAGKSLSDLDYTYLAASQEAEKDQFAAALEMEARAKQVLEDANRKANRRIKVGLGMLGLAGAMLTGSLVFSAQTVQSAKRDALDAQDAAHEARTAAQESQSMAITERQNATLARQDVEKATHQTKLAHAATQQAKANTQQAKLMAQQAQAETEQSRINTQSAKAEKWLAIADLQQVQRQMTQVQSTLGDAKQQLTEAQAERLALKTGVRLERSALTLLRQTPRPDLNDLATAIALGKELQPFTQGKTVAAYPTTTPLLALQTFLHQMPLRSVLSESLAIDITLQDLARVWFSADTSRYATLKSYDGWRRSYYQLWTNQGLAIGNPVETGSWLGSMSPTPLSIYLKAKNPQPMAQEQDLIAIDCGESTVCIKDFSNRQVDQVPGVQAAFNPVEKELLTIDQTRTLRRWKLFEQGKWVGQKLSETQFPPGKEDLYFTSSGRHVWTYQKSKILVFDLTGHVVKEFEGKTYKGSPVVESDLAFSPSGDLIGKLQLRNLPGQGSQRLTHPALKDSEFGFLQSGNHLATIQQNPTAKIATFQLLSPEGHLIHEYQVQNQSLQLLIQPSGNHVATVECPLNNDGGCTSRIWNAQGQQVKVLSLTVQEQIQWTPRGRYLATWENNKRLRLTSLQSASPRTYKLNGRLLSFQTTQTTSDLYFSVGQGGQVELWRADQPRPIAKTSLPGMNTLAQEAWFDELQQKIFAVGMHPEYGTSLFSSNLDRIDTFPETASTLEGGGGSWFFSPQGNRVAVSRANGDLILLNLQGMHLANFLGHQGEIDTVKFSPDGSKLLTYSSTDQTARIWDLQGRQLAEYPSLTVPSINAGWTQIITLEQPPKLNARIPDRQLKVWSMDSLEMLITKACQRLEPTLKRQALEDRHHTVCN